MCISSSTKRGYISRTARFYKQHTSLFRYGSYRPKAQNEDFLKRNNANSATEQSETVEPYDSLSSCHKIRGPPAEVSAMRSTSFPRQERLAEQTSRGAATGTSALLRLDRKNIFYNPHLRNWCVTVSSRT